MIAFLCWWFAASLVVAGLWVLGRADLRDPIASAISDIFLVLGVGIMSILVI